MQVGHVAVQFVADGLNLTTDTFQRHLSIDHYRVSGTKRYVVVTNANRQIIIVTSPTYRQWSYQYQAFWYQVNPWKDAEIYLSIPDDDQVAEKLAHYLVKKQRDFADKAELLDNIAQKINLNIESHSMALNDQPNFELSLNSVNAAEHQTLNRIDKMQKRLALDQQMLHFLKQVQVL
jgi:hypothetical protein